MNEAQEQWGSGHMICLFCGDSHVGTWLIGSEPVECSRCGNMGCVPHDGVGFGEAQALAQEHHDHERKG